MRKYCYFIIVAAMHLCGCERNSGVVDYVYNYNSPLTEVTAASTEIPADTYSEYMATYTPPSETGTDIYYYRLPYGQTSRSGLVMETAPKPENPFAEIPSADSLAPAVTAPKAEKPVTVTGETVMPSMEIPPADTLNIQTMPPKDTIAQTEESTVSCETSEATE